MPFHRPVQQPIRFRRSSEVSHHKLECYAGTSGWRFVICFSKQTERDIHPMPHKYLECIGAIATGFAWLEDLVTDLLHTLSGSTKTAVFTRRMSFSAKCDRLLELVKEESDEQYVADVRKWIGDCREIAKDRNAAVHSKHSMSESGQWRRLLKKTEVEVPVEQLIALHDRIAGLYECGEAYLIIAAERSGEP